MERRMGNTFELAEFDLSFCAGDIAGDLAELRGGGGSDGIERSLIYGEIHFAGECRIQAGRDRT